MAGQAQAPVIVNGTRPTTDVFTALLKDDIFLAIHNAYLLGWSIVELKSRIQIAACSPEQIKHTITSNVTPETQSIETLIKGIVLADLEAITQQEMLYYVQKSLDLPEKEQSSKLPQKALPSELRDQEWLTNVLRALFNRIVTLHINRFPDSDTTSTIYTIQSIRSSLDYLNGAYAAIGITPIKNDGSGQAFKAHFDLYDVTRRAINCLTLLLTTAEATLVKQTIEDNQKQLVDKVLGTSYATDPDKEISPDDKAAVIKQLSNLIVQLLDAWDSFLRECYYVDPDAHNTELELTAYESGRSLASLSWNASVILAPLENVFKFKQGSDIQVDQSGAVQQSSGAAAAGISTNNPPANQTTLEATKQGTPPDEVARIKAEQAKIAKACKTWLNVFNDRDVNYIQYQIMALSIALDEAYYRVNPSIKRTDPNDPTIPPNPDLPSQAIQAVVQSLNYWQRAITRICSQEDDVKPLPNPQQGNKWTGAQATKPAGNSSDAGQTPKPVLDWGMSIDLRTELTQQSYIWQSLLLCQQGLQSFSIEKVTQKILNEFMSDLEQAMKMEFRRTALKWGIFALVILAIVAILIAGFSSRPEIKPLLQNPLTYIAAVAALLAPFVNGLRSRFSQFGNSLGSRFGAAGTAVEQGIEHGYDQVLIEFNYLNHNIGITYPLVEFFLWEEIEYIGPSNRSEAIKDGYDFLVHVFWTSEDREEELQRVVRAAFGPIGAFIGAQLHTQGTSSRLWSGITRSGSKPMQATQLRSPASRTQSTPAK